MIQRIQSVYLLLAGVAGVLMFFFPLASYTIADLKVIFGLVMKEGASDMDPALFIGQWPVVLALMVLADIILVFSIIFLYRKRNPQGKLTMIAVLFTMLIIILEFWLSDRLSGHLNTQVRYEPATFMPVISLLFLMMAYRGIRKDDKLVRSADRLR